MSVIGATETNGYCSSALGGKSGPEASSVRLRTQEDAEASTSGASVPFVNSVFTAQTAAS